MTAPVIEYSICEEHLIKASRQPLAYTCLDCHCMIVDRAGDLCPACETRRNLSRGQQPITQAHLGAF